MASLGSTYRVRTGTYPVRTEYVPKKPTRTKAVVCPYKAVESRTGIRTFSVFGVFFQIVYFKVF